MRAILAAALLCCTSPLLAADMVAKHPGGDVLRIMDKPCTNAAVQKHLNMLPDRWQAAVATVDGKVYPACWILRPDGVVIVRYEDGDGGLIPMQFFKPAHEV